MRDAHITAKAILTPFAPALLVSADIDARDVNLAQFAAALPATTLTLTLSARPTAEGFAGTLSAQNPAAGALDAGRVPVAALTSRFAWDGKVLVLDDVDAQIAGNGRATGKVALPISGGPLLLDLTLANIDLARIQSTLIATRLSGTLAASVAQQKQIVRADLRQADMALAFAAAIVGRHVDVEQLRAQAGGGEIAGRGSFDLDGKRPFTFTARATRFNPARFVDMPAAQLDGTVTARGTLTPTWDVSADVALNTGSRFAGLAVAGTARAHATPSTAKDVAVDLHIGAASITLTGGFGTAADTLAYAVDVPRIQELRPLLARYAKAKLPDPAAGALRARGTVTGDPHSLGFAVNAHGEALQWGPSVRVATIELTASAAPGVGREGRVALEARPITLALAATGVTAPQGALAKLQASVTGTLANTRAASPRPAATSISRRRSRAVLPMPNVRMARSTLRGSAHSIRSPIAAPMRCGSRRLRTSRSRATASASATPVLPWPTDARSSRISRSTKAASTRADRLPACRLPRSRAFPARRCRFHPRWPSAAIGRSPPRRAYPARSTCGAKAATGSATENATLDPSDLALGIAVLELAGRVVDDAFAASARFRSARAGSADATATLAAGRVAGRIATDAPIHCADHRRSRVAAAIAAVDRHVGRHGRARAASHITGRGTLAQPIARRHADRRRAALRSAAVRRASEGRPLRARLADRAIVLDEFSLVGGKGRFTAKGTLARAADQADRRRAARSSGRRKTSPS